MIQQAADAERVDLEATELDRAESDAEHAGDQFEEAVLRLKDAVTHTTRPEVEAFVLKRLDNVRSEAMRMIANEPVKAFTVLFAAGVLAGAWITSFPRKGVTSGPV
jgi:hypothetical protein